MLCNASNAMTDLEFECGSFFSLCVENRFLIPFKLKQLFSMILWYQNVQVCSCQIDKWCHYWSLISGYYEEDLLTITNFILISVTDIKWHAMFYGTICSSLSLFSPDSNDLNQKSCFLCILQRMRVNIQLDLFIV